jgi:hypothetical protein
MSFFDHTGFNFGEGQELRKMHIFSQEGFADEWGVRVLPDLHGSRFIYPIEELS